MTGKAIPAGVRRVVPREPAPGVVIDGVAVLRGGPVPTVPGRLSPNIPRMARTPRPAR